MTPKTYQDNFFGFHSDDSFNSAKEVIPVILQFIKPASVIDIGCGAGNWLYNWKELGVTDFLGVDGSYVRAEDLIIDRNNFVSADLDNGFSTNRKFDLVTSLEVAEHIKPENADKFIASLCNLGDVIVFSAAIPGQDGTLHYNEQYPDYWIEKFAKHQFKPYDCLRELIWNNDKVSPWYRQNVLFFVKDTVKEIHPLISSNTKKILPLVHPEIYRSRVRDAAYNKRILKSPYTAMRYFAGKFLKRKK